MDDFCCAYIHFDTTCMLLYGCHKINMKHVDLCRFNVHFIMLSPFSKTETYIGTSWLTQRLRWLFKNNMWLLGKSIAMLCDKYLHVNQNSSQLKLIFHKRFMHNLGHMAFGKSGGVGVGGIESTHQQNIKSYNLLTSVVLPWSHVTSIHENLSWQWVWGLM
jgi:hypothetical protein